MEIILMSLLFVLLAGLINGSFAGPMKYMLKWREENVWFVFSLWGFILLPILSLYLWEPDSIQVLDYIPTKLLWVIVAGGIAFGIGQIAFVGAFRYIGIGLAFVVNISIGTASSALIPILWHKEIMGTTYSYLQLGGIAAFIFAVSMGAAAGFARDRAKLNVQSSKSNVREIEAGKIALGLFLAVIAGIGSAAQGVTYIWANPYISEVATSEFKIHQLPASIIVWVLIFAAAWIPYVLYFLIQNIKNRSFGRIFDPHTIHYWLLTILMGCGYWGSLILFSKASNEIGGDMAPTIAWPLFMIFIILTSNMWSWKSGEWSGAGISAIKKMWVSIGLFAVAIAIFSFSSKYHPSDSQSLKIPKHEIHHHFIKHKNCPTFK